MFDELLLTLENIITHLNTSKYMAGIMMLFMNLGGRYIALELSDLQESILNHKIIRRLLVFVLVFYATKDIKVSLTLTAVFIVLVSGIFHEDSKYCILPIKNNEKRVITKSEYEIAKEIVTKYEKQKIIENFVNY